MSIEFNKIYTTDCLKGLKKLDDESIDLVITSPPYWDILNRKRTADYKEIRNYSDSDKDLGNINDYEIFLEELKKV